MSNIISGRKEIRKLRRRLREIKEEGALLKADIKILRMEMNESFILGGGHISSGGLSALFRLQKK